MALDLEACIKLVGAFDRIDDQRLITERSNMIAYALDQIGTSEIDRLFDESDSARVLSKSVMLVNGISFYTKSHCMQLI